MDPLGSRTFDHAIIYPTSRKPERPGKLLMGVFDENGAYIDGSALDRRAGEVGAPTTPADYPQVLNAAVPEAIYAGTLYFHFGHFLLESLARAWYAADHPDLPLVWAAADTWQDMQFAGWQREILEILGLTNPISMVSRPTRFGRLHIPDIGYRYDDRFHPDHAHFLAKYSGPPQEPGRRIWLSRSQWTQESRDLNSQVVERRLAAEGWTIIAPEKLSVRQQLDELSRASVVAGEEGSAFHAVMLMTGIKDKKLRIFRRKGPEHRNLRTIGGRRVIDQEFFTLEHEVVFKAEGRVVVKTSPNASEILDALQVPVRPVLVREPVARSQLDVLEELRAALNAKRYLDAGEVGDAFHLFDIADKTAVDTFFTFDPRQFERDGVSCYELPFARYVEAGLWRGTGLLPASRAARPFDIIRLSGRREEVFADFAAGQPLAGPSTVWFVDLACDEPRLRQAVTRVGQDFQIVALKERGIGYLVYSSPGTLSRRIGRLHRSDHARAQRIATEIARPYTPTTSTQGMLMTMRRTIGARLDTLIGTQRTDRLRAAERRFRQAAARRLAPAPPSGQPRSGGSGSGGAAKAAATARRGPAVGERAMAAQGYIPSDPHVPHPKPPMSRYDFLAALHAHLEPRTYLEIGVNKGRSLTLSRVPTIGVDPAFQIEMEIHCDLDLIKKTSDDFFDQDDPTAHLNGQPVDLGFIDGMHLSDYALRDFINLERFTASTSVVVFDDVLPRNPLEAARVRRTGAWAGDVYKAPETIARLRPASLVLLVNTDPTGTAIVLGLDPASSVLADAYDDELDYLRHEDPQTPPHGYLDRSLAVDPTVLLASRGWPLLVEARRTGDPDRLADALRELSAIPKLGAETSDA